MGKEKANLHGIFSAYTPRQHHLEVVYHEKYLGLAVDADLIRVTHISDKINKANRIVSPVRRSFMYLDQ